MSAPRPATPAHADGRAAADARRLRHLHARRPPTARAGHAHLRRARDRRASAGLLRPGRFEPRGQRARARRPARAARLRAAQRAASRRSPARRPIDLRAPLFTLALLLLLVDTLASLWLGGHLANLLRPRCAGRARRRRSSLALALLLSTPRAGRGRAGAPPPPSPRTACNRALVDAARLCGHRRRAGRRDQQGRASPA